MFNRVRRWASGFIGGATAVQEGQQSGEPESYADAAASTVSENTALQVSEVFGAARLLSETFGCLPVDIYQRSQKGVIAEGASQLRQVLALSPNSLQTPVEFYENMQLNLVLHGNAYARIQRNQYGVIGLWPIAAQSITPVVMSDGSLTYQQYKGVDVVAYASKDILHIKLFGNGVVGLSPIGYARNTIGLAQATDAYQGKIFKHGGKPSGVLHVSGNLTKAQRQEVRRTFIEMVEEKEFGERLVVLPHGDKYDQTQMSPADLELLEQRKFTTSQILRFMGNIPGPLVGHMSESTVWGSGIEQMFLAWYRTGLNPYASRWEQAIEKRLMTPEQRLNWKIEFDFDALLRGDSNTQAQVMQKLVGGPVWTPNEGRAAMGKPPVEDGDKLNPSPTHSKEDSKQEKTNAK